VLAAIPPHSTLWGFLAALDDEYAKEIMQVPLPRSFQDEIDQYNLILFEIEEKYNADYERLTNGDYQVGFAEMFRKENTKYKIFPCPLFEQK